MHRLLDPNQSSMFRLSLRVQLSLWVVLIFTLIQWVSTVIAWVFLSGSIYSSFDDFFLRHSVGVAAKIQRELPRISRAELHSIESEQLTQVRFHSFHIDVFDMTGGRLVDPGSEMAQLVLPEIDRAIDSSGPVLLESVYWASPPTGFDEANMIVVIQRVVGRDGKAYILLQATDNEYAQNRVLQMGQTLLVTSLSAPFLALIAGWFISGIAVAPLSKVQELVAGLKPESLDEPLKIEENSTEVQDLVLQLNESRAQIRSAFESQARFISNVSHELKTPIAIMQIESETLQIDDSSEEVKEFVQSVRDEMTRLGRMIESFLTLTRIEDGFGKVGGTLTAFNDLVMDSLDHCIAMAHQNAIELDPVLFDTDETISLGVQGDSDLLITMLNNLIRNAIRYTPTAGIVHIKLEQMNDQVLIHVEDEGPGIPDDRIDSVFDRFARVEDTNRAGRGHGLGLAIAKGIAELHGGSIRVKNNPTQGCTFTVELPWKSTDHSTNQD